MKLVLGVLEQAYSDAKSGSAQTTGAVAEILEDRYHVMETFYDTNADQIKLWIADAMQKAIEAKFQGAPIQRNPFLGVTEKIQNAFKVFLTSRQMEHLFAQLTTAEAEYFVGKTGGFTGRASRGASKRHKKPDAKRKSRPAFIDTGLYMASFRSWIKK